MTHEIQFAQNLLSGVPNFLFSHKMWIKFFKYIIYYNGVVNMVAKTKLSIDLIWIFRSLAFLKCIFFEKHANVVSIFRYGIFYNASCLLISGFKHKTKFVFLDFWWLIELKHMSLCTMMTQLAHIIQSDGSISFVFALHGIRSPIQTRLNVKL